MIRTIVMKQPSKVRDESLVTDDRVIIPTELNPNEVFRETSDNIGSPEKRLERSVYLASRAQKRPMKSISDIIHNK